MSRHPGSIPRAAAGVAAMALSALTLGLLVGVPAHVAPPPAPSQAAIAAVPPIEAVVYLGRIEVAALRVPEVAAAPAANESAARKRGS
jgi:hypothetical protein